MATKKIYDVVVFGATGDAGRCVCLFLHNKAKLANITSWAPAARNLKKLDSMLKPVMSEGRVVPVDGVGSSPSIKADANSYEEVLAMARQAKVVIACAGPFADYGENVVKACVEAGTDYVDITGETPWVNVMTKKYGAVAKSKGLYMLSQSAYDSVPSDITVALAAKMLSDKGEHIAATETHHKLKGGALPVGTLNTMLKMVTSGRRAAISTVTLGLAGGPTKEEKAKAAATKSERAKLKDVSGLVPKAVKSAISKDGSVNMMKPYSALSGTWSLPSFMAGVNTPIVHTTAHHLGYGASEGHGFTYKERLGGMKGTRFYPYARTMATFLVGAILALPFFIPMVLLFPNFTFQKIKNYNNSDPGNVKAKAFKKLFNGFQPNGLTSVIALASSSSGKSGAKVTFASDYDAGLGFTALSAATVAGSLIVKRANGEIGKGFETAVVAVGPEELKTRYMDVGVRIEAILVNKSKL